MLHIKKHLKERKKENEGTILHDAIRELHDG